MRQQMNNTGIVLLAQNNTEDDYVQQACLLAMSAKVTNPSLPVSLITNDVVPQEYQALFDKIIPIPFGDHAADTSWKVENRWKIYHVTPYEKTIVMDTDMLVLQDISSWINFLDNYEMYFTNTVYTYRNIPVSSNFYRKTFVTNDLPNIYSGFHYFKKCEFAHEFYRWLEFVTYNWEKFYELYANKDDNGPRHYSVDVSAAIVTKILGCEDDITNKISKFPSFTHMKPHVQNWKNVQPSWQECVGTYINDNCEIKIGNQMQLGIFHYTENSFVGNNRVFDTYRRYLSV